jgi:HK97 family phage portal protein
MAVWPWQATRTTTDVSAALRAASPVPNNASGVFPLGFPTVTATGPVSRRDALSVPAVARGVNLIASTLATLPVERIHTDPEGRKVRVPLGTFMECPEKDTPRFSTIAKTAMDLLLDGQAYWVVLARNAEGFPAQIRYVPLDEMSWTADDWGVMTSLTFRDRTYPARDIIAFPGWTDGILTYGAEIIRTAIALEGAARRYADAPIPSLIVKNTSNYELAPSEVDQLLADVKRARQESAVGYLNGGVDLDTMGWDAAQLQLVEARVFTNAAIANMIGIPAHFIAASNPGGSSLTYSNVSQEARLLQDYSMRPLITAMESRLAMQDVTPRGHHYRFEMDSMLRGNPMERSQLYMTLIQAGILTVEEAREWEDLAPKADTDRPAPTAEPPAPAPQETP